MRLEGKLGAPWLWVIISEDSEGDSWGSGGNSLS